MITASAPGYYIFGAPDADTLTVDVYVMFRRALYELMQQKGWDVPDIVMEHEQVSLP